MPYSIKDPEKTTKLTKNDSVIGIREKNDSEARSLQRILLGLYNTRIKDQVDTLEGESFDTIRRKLNPFIESVVKKYMVRSYERAGQQLLNRLKISSVPFFNISDDGNKAIDIQINLLLEKFWSRIAKIEKRNQPLAAAITDVKIDDTGDVTVNDNPLDIDAYMTGLALLIIGTSFNMGKRIAPGETVTKLQKFGVSEGDDQIQRLRDLRYEFVSKRDGNVDPKICEPLDDGTIYSWEDPTLPNPPMHNYCRCILREVTTGEEPDLSVVSF